MTENTTAPKFVSRQEAASALGVTVDDVDRLISNGLLSRWRVRGRYIRVLRSEVDELAALPTDWLRNS
jgi:excisionase family DNA binding protein